MNPTIHWATTVRILIQLRRDRRTVFMILLVPALLVVLLHCVLSRQPVGPDGRTPFDRIAITQLGVLPGAVMFPITAITMRRERSNGTLDRLFATPMTKLDLLAGYGTAFSLAAAAQSGIVAVVAFRVTHLQVAGSPLLVFVISLLGSILGVSLGLLFSAFAATEFQAAQFSSTVLVPQLFLAGVLVPRDVMPGWLQGISNALPPSYADESLQHVSTHPPATPRMWHDHGIVTVFI
ncbi:MAG: ABC transporter permease, partial [Mycolicibacterium sp.]|nr:ABC transporter permease [Mycolicibacterium sp.]